MLIRKAKSKDVRGIAKLYLQFWKAHPGVDPLITPKNKPTMKSEIKAAAKDIRKKNEYHFVADDNGRIAGYIELCIKKNHRIFKVRKFGYINSIVVDKKCRGKGIARMLVKYASGFFRQKRLKYVRLNVYFSNKAAQKAWSKIGFRNESMFMIKRIF